MEQQIIASKSEKSQAERFDNLTEEVVRNQVVKFGDATREIRTSKLRLSLQVREEDAEEASEEKMAESKPTPVVVRPKMPMPPPPKPAASPAA